MQHPIDQSAVPVTPLGAATGYWGAITGEPLPANLAKAARAEEIEFMLDWQVWEEVPVEQSYQVTGKKPHMGNGWMATREMPTSP